MKLLNVRLGPDETRIVTELRRDGIQISKLVREALHSAYRARQASSDKPQDPRDIMERIYAEFPDPPHSRRSRVDLRDHRSVRRAILRAMKRPKR